MLKMKDVIASKREAFSAQMANDESTQEQILTAQEDYFNAIAEGALVQVKEEMRELEASGDQAIALARGLNALTSEEMKFYDELKEGESKANETPRSKGVETDLIVPETIIERVFDEIVQDRPILRLIRFSPTVGRVKIIRSRRKGIAVFGPLNKDLEGQLDAEFDATEYVQLALTAFFLVSNDALDLGPVWLDRYVRLCLGEAVSEAWEKAIICGTGNNEPIGLLKDLDKPVTKGVHSDKEAAGTLTFADPETMVKEFSAVLKKASEWVYKIGSSDKTGEKKFRKVNGKVYLIVNPVNYYDIVARATTINAAGAYVTNLPFIGADHIIESLYVPENKLIAFVEGEYEATTSRPEKIYVYDQTFAMKRATLYATDMLANGQPTNNDACQVYTIKLPTNQATTSKPS